MSRIPLLMTAAVLAAPLAAQSISENVAPNNGLTSGAPTVFLDLDIQNPLGINLTHLDTFCGVPAVPFTVDIWLKQDHYLTFERVPAAWTKVATASGISTTTTTISTAVLPTPLYLPPGQYGVGLQHSAGARYQGTGSSTILTTVSNSDLSMTLGASLSSTLAAPFTGTSLFAPRKFSGTLYYTTYLGNSGAGFGFFGPGCPGSMGASHLTGNLPQLGSQFSVTIDRLPLSAAILLTGFSRTTSQFGPLPLDLSIFGAPNCPGRVSPDVTQFVVGANNIANTGFFIPNDPSLGGVQLYQQAFVLDPGFNSLGAVMSDAVALLLGL